MTLSVVVPMHVFAAEEGAKKAEKQEAEKKEAEKPEKNGKDNSDVTGGRFEGDPIYVHVPPMILPIINQNGAEQLVTIILDIQAKNFHAADQLHTNMPRVMDSLMRALYGGLGEGSLRNGKLVNVDKVKNMALRAVGNIVGADNITDVLIQGVSQRML